MDEKIKKISLGTAQFGLEYGLKKKRTSKENIRKIILESFDLGVHNIDTSPLYGRAEKILGEIGVKKWNVYTKIPRIPNDIRNYNKWINETLVKSLRKLKVDTLEGVLIHHPNDLKKNNINEIFNSLKNIKKKGLVKSIGISLYSDDYSENFLKKKYIDFIQAPLNIVDQNLLKSGIKNRLKKNKIKIQVRSIFLQGILLMQKRKIGKKFNKWIQVWQEIEKIQNLFNIKPMELCLNYVFSQDDISNYIIGFENHSQFKDVINTLKNKKITKINLPKNIYIKDKYFINPSYWKNN